MDFGADALAGLGGGVIVSLLFLICGLAVLAKGADVFVEHASAVAARFGIPVIVIGLTIVAMGTSAPEAAVSIAAAVKGNSGIALGNVVGSNILNVLIILGICALRKPLPIQRDTLKFEMPALIAVTLFFIAYCAGTGSLGKLGGVVFLVMFAVYLGYMGWQIKKSNKTGAMENPKAEPPSGVKKTLNLWLSALFIVFALAAIVIGSDFAVAGATSIASDLGISDRIIGLTIIALGTSLPELVTSVIAVGKGKTDIAVGNIVGSNLFNIMFVLGMTSIVSKTPLAWEAGMTFDGIVALGAAAVLLITALTGKKVARLEGGAFLLCYAGYVAYILVN